MRTLRFAALLGVGEVSMLIAVVSMLIYSVQDVSDAVFVPVRGLKPIKSSWKVPGTGHAGTLDGKECLQPCGM